MTSTDPLIIITESSPKSATVAIEGVLDCTGSVWARKALDELIAGGCLEIVIDLKEVAGIDSLGIGVLLSAWWQVRNAGGNLVLWRPQGLVRWGIENLGMDEVIEVRCDLG